MESGQQRSNLTKLSETDLSLEEPWQDIRGLEVYDIADEQIGSVADLYVDRETRLASFVVVSAGDFLRIGKKQFLIPVEKVSRDVGEERVTVTQNREKVLNSPEFGPDVDAHRGESCNEDRTVRNALDRHREIGVSSK